MVDFQSRLESSRRLQQPTFSQDRLGQLSRKNDRLQLAGRLLAESRHHYTLQGHIGLLIRIWYDRVCLTSQHDIP